MSRLEMYKEDIEFIHRQADKLNPSSDVKRMQAVNFAIQEVDNDICIQCLEGNHYIKPKVQLLLRYYETRLQSLENRGLDYLTLKEMLEFYVDLPLCVLDCHLHLALGQLKEEANAV